MATKEESQNICSNNTSIKQDKKAKQTRKDTLNAQQIKDKHRTPTTNGKYTKQQI